MGVPGILLVAAFLLTLIASLWGGPSAPYVVRFPHLGWLGVSLYFLVLVLGGR
jgi:hypothetical protein